MGARVSKKQFTVVGTDEPHVSRRKLILAKYPQIRRLYGPDIRLMYQVLVLVSVQLAFAIAAPQLPWWQFFLAAYVVGGSITHALSLANHELSHNLAFHEPIYNEILGIIANFAQGLPSCITFKKYHLEHHYYQGVEGIDTDIPTDWEGKVFNNTSKKVIWALCQPLFYAIRPLVVKPKSLRKMELLNTIAVVGFNYLLWKYAAPSAVGFNLLSTVLGMGLHPVAGHFISEHYVFTNDQETYSYYGPLNWLCFNVGYHNEHHDFPKVAGVNLPKVREIASEFYEDLAQHPSWVKVIWDYIMRSDVGPYSRVKRVSRLQRAESNTESDKFKDD